MTQKYTNTHTPTSHPPDDTQIWIFPSPGRTIFREWYGYAVRYAKRGRIRKSGKCVYIYIYIDRFVVEFICETQSHAGTHNTEYMFSMDFCSYMLGAWFISFNHNKWSMLSLIVEKRYFCAHSHCSLLDWWWCLREFTIGMLLMKWKFRILYNVEIMCVIFKKKDFKRYNTVDGTRCK